MPSPLGHEAGPVTERSLTDSNGRCHSGNPVRGRLNALFFQAMDGYLHHLLSESKRGLFQNLPERVVELGSGIGANFRYFAKGTRVVAVEPNPHMHGGLANTADKFGIDLSILPCGAEAIDLPDDSVNAVVCTLVLCTVADPAGALREVRRILRPDGRFIFLEHVAAPAGSWRRHLQDAMHRPWRYCFEGCNTNRNTPAFLEDAGFTSLAFDQYRMSSPFIPVNLLIAGVATE